ncbi:MAG TPA: DUF58 domain-containing protein [Chloroflexota bacterium]|nr:DUF58 domain-containing protein [Chloroflexota bacterium]
MNHEFVALIAKLLVYILLLTIPILVIAYSERFQRRLAPGQYVTLFAIGTVVGVLLFVPAISIVAATGLLAIGAAWLSARFSLTGLSYHRTMLPSRLFPGDSAELKIRLDNNKFLPLASVTITDPIHFGLIRATHHLDDLIRFSGGVQLTENLGYGFTNRTAVRPFQSVERTYRLEAVRRGVYTLGPATVETSDPFGLFPRTATFGDTLDLIVYPRVYRPEEVGLPFLETMGEASSRRKLADDLTRIAGTREYQAGDPLNRMHWKATARTGSLQVRLFDPSTTTQLMIVLNLNTFQHVWQGVDLDRMEAAIDLAASMSLWALDRGFAVGIRSNGQVPGAELTPRVAASANPQQATLLLEHLARLSFSGRYSPEHVLADEARRVAAGGSIMFVTSIVTPAAISVLTSRQLAGRVSVVYCGRFAAPVVRGVPIYLATPKGSTDLAVS